MWNKKFFIVKACNRKGKEVEKQGWIYSINGCMKELQERLSNVVINNNLFAGKVLRIIECFEETGGV